MIKNEFLSAWDPESDADILDSTEYLRKELLASLKNTSEEFTPLRFTQELSEELKAYAPEISPFIWVLHEPETLREMYRIQEQEGANAAVAQSAQCFSAAESDKQAKTALAHAMQEAEGNNAIFFVADLDVNLLVRTDLNSIDEARKAKLSLYEQLKLFKEHDAHGVWITLDSIDFLPIVCDALHLEPNLPAILRFNCIKDAWGCRDALEEYGLCIHFNTLSEAHNASDQLVKLAQYTNTHIVIEVDSLDMSEEASMLMLENLKRNGFVHYRPGRVMSRNERVLLYSFV